MKSGSLSSIVIPLRNQPRARRGLPACLAIGLILAGSLAAAGGADPPPARNVGWPLIGNTSQNSHFAELAQVNTHDVRRLHVAWTRGEGFGQFDWETFPVVLGSRMYYSTNTDEVLAVDAASGRLDWTYTPEVDFLAGPQGFHSSPDSRGVTVAAGRVYDLTADDRLIALDARSGSPIWSVRVADPNEGYSENSPGTYWRGEIIIGGPAGDSGLRGFVAAYDAASGRELWRTYVIPPRGTGWLSAGGSHGGGDVWMEPTVDPGSGTVYVATGNPTPAFSNAERRGCDPWADATVALNARNGAFEWGHSEVCEDSWDYDTDQSPILFDLRVKGHAETAVGDGSKSGFYSILDAHTGSLIARSPELTDYSTPHLAPTAGGSVVCPGIFGGLEYGPPAYSPQRTTLYVPGTNMCMRYTVNPPSVIRSHASGEPDLEGTAVQVGPATGVVAAVQAGTGRVAWRTRLPKPATGGALATAGGLVFVGDDNGRLYALRQSSGAIVWRANLGLRFGSAPIAYEISGTEYIAVAAGGSALVVPGDAPAREGRLFVFRLGRKQV